MLSGVDDVFNAVTVIGDSVGEVVFYGRGAGKLPTASAVVADIIDCAKHLEARKYISWDEGFEGYVEDIQNAQTKLYVRLSDVDQATKSSVLALFGNKIENYYNEITKEFVFITNPEVESELRNSISKITNCKIETILHAI